MKIILCAINRNIISAWENLEHQKEYVETYHGSILDISCDAIVSPANSFGFMDGGIDLAISRFFGKQVVNKLQKKIEILHHGELLVGQAEIIPTEHDKIPYLISAPTMRVPSKLKNTVNIYLAIRAIILLIKYGKFDNGDEIKNTIKTIAIPGMGTGTGQVKPATFAGQMYKALNDFLDENIKFPNTLYEASKKNMQIITG